jgi:predicted metal-dependent HD superfamily phosphohydrolase
MSVTLAAWHALWRELGAPPDDALFGRLVAAYSEPQRHYHTLQHLRECLELWQEVRHLAERPAEVEVALWFHDAIYDPTRHDNEERSADWAQQSVAGAGLRDDVAARVHALVMATRHDAVPEDGDARLLVDVDLAILGAAPERFDAFDAQVRREYAHVPEAGFRVGRSSVLRGFLQRPQLYATESFRRRFEARARENLARAIEHWS